MNWIGSALVAAAAFVVGFWVGGRVEERRVAEWLRSQGHECEAYAVSRGVHWWREES